MINRFQSILAALLVLWVPLAFYGRAADGFTLTKELVAAVVIVFFAARTVWEGRWVFRQPLFQAMFLFTAWMILDSLGAGLLKMEVLKGSVHLLLILGTFLGVIFVASRGFAYEKMLRYALLAATLVSLYGLVQSFGVDRGNWTTQFEKRAFSTLGNPDYLGDYLAALLPPAFLLRLREHDRKGAWLWLNATLLIGAALLATRVRGAEAAALAGFLVLGTCLLSPWGKPLAKPNQLFLKATLALALFLGVIWGALHWKDFGRPQISVQQRMDTYRVTWEMVKDHPWFGIGLGQLGAQFPAYQAKPWTVGDYAEHPYTYTEHVHNEFLQFWVEGGLPGLLFFLVVLGVFFGAGANFLRNPESRDEEKELLMGAVAGLASLLVQSLSNFPLQVAPTAVLFGFYLAAPLALRKPSAPIFSRVSTAQKAGLTLLVSLTAIAGLRTVGASIAFRDTMGESSAGHGQLAAYYGARLVSLSPLNPKAWNAYGKALDTEGKPEEAYLAYQKAVDLNPDYVENLLPMAEIRVQEGRFQEVVDLCQRALAVTPNYPAPLWPLAVGLFELKRYEESAKTFQDYLVYNPNDFQTYLDLGVCYIQLKRKADAVAAWKKAYALNPTDPQVAQYLKSQGVNPNP